VIRTVVAEDSCPARSEGDGGGLIHVNYDSRGAFQCASYGESLVLSSMYDRIKCVRRVHHEVVVFSSVLYIAIVDYDLVALIDGDPVRGENVVRYPPDILVKR